MPPVEEAYDTVYQLRELSKQKFPFTNHPRENVSWYQAVAFCRWLGDKLGAVVALPHEHEWEVAARYPDNRFFPWGNEFAADKANIDVGDAAVEQTTTVGLYPAGQNRKLGLHDLGGNVWEWCSNKYAELEETVVDDSGARRVLRGGSWYGNLLNARAMARVNDYPVARYNFFGFRVIHRIVLP